MGVLTALAIVILDNHKRISDAVVNVGVSATSTFYYAVVNVGGSRG